MNVIKVAILEPSMLIRMGLEAMLRKASQFKVSIKTISEDPNNDYSTILANLNDTILFVDPLYLGFKPKQRFNIPNTTKIVAISHGVYCSDKYNGYDEVISLCCNIQNLIEVMLRLIKSENILAQGNDSQTLTPREREIIVCVVKGLTNKQIAEQLYLSTHTVITHRRNITKKLQIHSTSGLTIYAIMNKLVELEDIEKKK